MSNYRYANMPQKTILQQIRPLYISHSVQEGEWHSTPHVHQCAELFYIVKGNGQFQIEDTILPVTENHVVLINPQIKHTEFSAAKNPMEYIVVGLENASLIQRGVFEERYMLMPCGEEGPEMLGYLLEMERELKHKPPLYEEVVKSLFTQLLVGLLRSQDLQFVEPPTQKSSRECANIKQYIDTHYAETITLDTLAQRAHLNKYYLVHLFTRQFGISPIQYLLERRLDESCYFLVNTDYRIVQISQILGFSSSSYFSQRFREKYATSPREYRRTQQQNTALSIDETAEGESG